MSTTRNGSGNDSDSFIWTAEGLASLEELKELDRKSYTRTDGPDDDMCLETALTDEGFVDLKVKYAANPEPVAPEGMGFFAKGITDLTKVVINGYDKLTKPTAQPLKHAVSVPNNPAQPLKHAVSVPNNLSSYASVKSPQPKGGQKVLSQSDSSLPSSAFGYAALVPATTPGRPVTPEVSSLASSLVLENPFTGSQFLLFAPPTRSPTPKSPMSPPTPPTPKAPSVIMAAVIQNYKS